MKSPLATALQTAMRKLTAGFHRAASGTSRLYRGTGANAKKAVADFNDADLRGKMRIAGRATASAGVAAGVVWGIGKALEPDAGPGLDPEVYELVAKSPTLSKNVSALLADGWTIRYGDIDKKGVVGLTSYGHKVITVSSKITTDPLWATAILAHETGHATAPADAYSTTEPHVGDDYQQWFDKNMYRLYQGESNAGLTTAQARKEILNAGGPDIGNIDDTTKDRYDSYAAGDLTREEAIDSLAGRMRGYGDYEKELNDQWIKFAGSIPSDAIPPDIDQPNSATDHGKTDSVPGGTNMPGDTVPIPDVIPPDTGGANPAPGSDNSDG